MPSYFCKAAEQFGNIPNCDGVCIKTVPIGTNNPNAGVQTHYRLEPCSCLGVMIPFDEFQTHIEQQKPSPKE